MPSKSSSAAALDRSLNQAGQLLRQSGARLTEPRQSVLAVLLAADHAMTHHEIEAALKGARHIDRVTIYRVLDWLAEQGLAHRIARDDRIWLYSAAGLGKAGQHAHFACTACGQTFCLEEVPVTPARRLPPGFESEAVELTIRGRCQHCKPLD